jgi:hypothetical protein
MWAQRMTANAVPTGASTGSSAGANLHPFLGFAKGGDGRAAILTIGDSGQGFGTSDSSVVTMLGKAKDGSNSGRLVFGYVERGFDDNTDTKRIATGNMAVAGSDPVQFAKDILAGTSKKFGALQHIKTVLGHAGFDLLFNAHFGNSASNTYDDGSAVGTMNPTTPGTYNAIGYINTRFNAELGVKVIANTSIVVATSTDAFATLAGQTPAASFTYPSGTSFASVAQGNAAYNSLGNSWKWVYDTTKFGSIFGSAPDATARIRSDYPNIVVDVTELYVLDLFDKTEANIDAIKLLHTGIGEPGYTGGEAVSGTLAAAYVSGTSISLDFKPRIGGSLVWVDDAGNTCGVYVHTVTGTGPYTVTWALAHRNPTATAAGRAVRESHAAHDGVHRSPAIHTYRYPAAVIASKKRLAAYGMAA